MSKKRRNFSSSEKLSILKRHFVGKEPVSDICEELSIHPNQFHRWQGELFNFGTSFNKPSESSKKKESEALKKLQTENEKLQRIINKKNTIIAEITEDYVRLKKSDMDD